MAGITFAFNSELNDSVFGKSQAPIAKFIEKRGEAFEAGSIINKLYNVIHSKHWGEKIGSMTGMDGFMPVGENGPHPIDNMQEGFSKIIEPMTWKNSFSISREAADDAVLLDLKKKPQAFVTSYYRTRELYAVGLIGAAIKGSDFAFRGRTWSIKTSDNKNLFDKEHPSFTSKTGKQSNKFQDAISASAIGAMECAMQGFTDDNGNVLDIAPDTIMIPNIYSLKNALFAAIGADKDPDTSNNGFNYVYGRWNVIVNPYLNQFITAGTAPWLMIDSRYNQDYCGLVWDERQPLEVTSKIDSDTDANKWNGFARFGAGFNDWRCIAVGGVPGGTQLITT